MCTYSRQRSACPESARNGGTGRQSARYYIKVTRVSDLENRKALVSRLNRRRLSQSWIWACIYSYSMSWEYACPALCLPKMRWADVHRAAWRMSLRWKSHWRNRLQAVLYTVQGLRKAVSKARVRRGHCQNSSTASVHQWIFLSSTGCCSSSPVQNNKIYLVM